jgi:hypothetical protein
MNMEVFRNVGIQNSGAADLLRIWRKFEIKDVIKTLFSRSLHIIQQSKKVKIFVI